MRDMTLFQGDTILNSKANLGHVPEIGIVSHAICLKLALMGPDPGEIRDRHGLWPRDETGNFSPQRR